MLFQNVPWTPKTFFITVHFSSFTSPTFLHLAIKELKESVFAYFLCNTLSKSEIKWTACYGLALFFCQNKGLINFRVHPSLFIERQTYCFVLISYYLYLLKTNQTENTENAEVFFAKIVIIAFVEWSFWFLTHLVF